MDIYFTNKGLVVNNSDINLDRFNEFIHIKANCSKKTILSMDITYKNKTEFIKTHLDEVLEPLTLSLINFNTKSNLWSVIDNHIDSYTNEYVNEMISEYSQYFDDRILMNGFLFGFMSYVSLFFILEKSNFMKTLPFQFYVPANLQSGDCCEFNVMQYMCLPISTFLQLNNTNTFIFNYFTCVMQFIQLWSNLFYIGPQIDQALITKINIDIINGVSKYNMAQLQQSYNSMTSFSHRDDSESPVSKFTYSDNTSNTQSMTCKKCHYTDTSNTQSMTCTKCHYTDTSNTHSMTCTKYDSTDTSNTHSMTCTKYDSTESMTCKKCHQHYKMRSDTTYKIICKTCNTSYDSEDIDIHKSSFCTECNHHYSCNKCNDLHDYIDKKFNHIEENIKKFIIDEIERIELIRQNAFADNLALYTDIYNDKHINFDIKHLIEKYNVSRIPIVKNTCGVNT